MLFDPAPKTRKEELFDREKELKSLERAVESSPIVLVLGIRRIGKTSLLKVFLSEFKGLALFLDARKLDELGYTRRALYTLLSDELTKFSKLHGVLEAFKGIRGVTVSSFGIELDWSRGASISKLFEKLDELAESRGEKALIVIDEAQLLRYLRGYGKPDIRQTIAYAYDNLRNVCFILSGSEIGLLTDFIGIEDPESPLYGRYSEVVELERFNRDLSLEFLRKGFEELRVNVSEELLERAVDSLDGIPGWLAYFGYLYSHNKKGLEDVIEEAVNLASSEIKKIARMSPHYPYVLKAVAEGNETWSEIKKAVELRTGRFLQSATLSRILENLIKMGILQKKEKKYSFPDPVVKEACRRYF